MRNRLPVSDVCTLRTPPLLSDAQSRRESESRKATFSLLQSVDRLLLQSRRFVLLEIRVISVENEALQALFIPKNIARNALALNFQEVDQSVSHAGDATAMEIVLSIEPAHWQLHGAFNSAP